MKIEISGTLTQGYYNAMEAGHPVFIDGDSIDDAIKDKLSELGFPTDFCDPDEPHPLSGKRVKVTIEIED